jgi:DNA-damage-inducible protein J
MIKMSQINIRLDESLKSQAEVLFSEMGMNMTTAINIFLRQAVREQAIPFKIEVSPSSNDFSIDDKKIIEEGLMLSLADVSAGRTYDVRDWLSSKRKELGADQDV